MLRKILILERSRVDSRIILDATDYGHPGKAAYVRLGLDEVECEGDTLDAFVHRCYERYATNEAIAEVDALLARETADLDRFFAERRG